MRDIQKQVGKRVRELREQKGISQEALASICSLHRTYVGLIERGERNLSLSTVAVIADGLGVAPADLFAGLDSKPSVQRIQKRSGKSSPDVAAHVTTIRRVLIEAGIVDAKRYDTLYAAALKASESG